MTKVVALQTWSNGSVTMDEKSVLDIDDALATDLIAKGIVADAAEYFSGSGGSLPPITDADDGKVLTANSGVWGAQEPIGKKFVVTLTPTALDYSGTMDKTVAEIDAAYEAGRKIVFSISVDGGATNIVFQMCAVGEDSSEDYPSFQGYLLYGGMIIHMYTTVQGDSNAYFTHPYQLTDAT